MDTAEDAAPMAIEQAEGDGRAEAEVVSDGHSAGEYGCAGKLRWLEVIIGRVHEGSGRHRASTLHGLT